MTVMPLQADLLERLLHFVEFEWLDDRLDLFHVVSGLRALFGCVQLSFASKPVVTLMS